MPIVGLCGAHRVGKSSLGRAVAERSSKCSFVMTNISKCLIDAGYDPSNIQTLDFDRIIEAQKVVLSSLSETYRNLSSDRIWIVDRTPLDALAYLRSAVNGKMFYDHLIREDINKIALYADECFSITRKYLDGLVLIQPGIPLVSQEGKALANKRFQDHINTLLLGDVYKLQHGLSSSSPHIAILEHEIISFDKRVDYLNSKIGSWFY